MHRTWDPAQHPQWLVFEVEGQLQIRPQQHAIAQHLMLCNGAIAQLNMGEGKTRVILPLLALHWADGSRVVGGWLDGWLTGWLPLQRLPLQNGGTAAELASSLFTCTANALAPACTANSN